MSPLVLADYDASGNPPRKWPANFKLHTFINITRADFKHHRLRRPVGFYPSSSPRGILHPASCRLADIRGVFEPQRGPCPAPVNCIRIRHSLCRSAALESHRAMDKLPKLRRKPKPPTIETSIVRPRRDESQERPASASSSGTTTSIQALAPKPSMRRSPLQSLRLRVSAKRARTNSPAAHPSSSPVAAVFSQDAQHRTSANRAPRPQMPAFLNSSPQGTSFDRRQNEISS